MGMTGNFNGPGPYVVDIPPPVSGAGNFTVNSRDGLGRVTSYTDASGTTYTITYGSFGPVTISGGGQIRTYSYNAAGQMTGCTLS